MRNYLIFKLVSKADEPPTWETVGNVQADGSDEALRLYFSEPPAAEGVFVAVTERAFKPRTVKSTVRTSLGDF